MLRFSSTRIHLSRCEFDGLEDRMQARQSARLTKPQPSNIRLRPGPARPTRLSVVPADHNVGRQRASSSSSDLVVEGQHCGRGTEISCPRDLNRARVDLQSLQQHAAEAREGAADLYRSPPRPSPGHDSLSEERREIEDIEREIAEHSPASHFDGVNESELGSLPPMTPFRPLAMETQPRAFSSARARRRHARSSDEPGLHYRGIRPFSTQSHMWLDPVPQLVLPPSGPSEPSMTRFLDPGAPVFVPRMRFGVAETSRTNERPWRSLESSRLSNLRVRSSGELNVEPVASRRPRQRQRSRPSDQNSAFPLPLPNLERYPLLRPSPTLAAPQGPNSLEHSQYHQSQNYHVRHALTSSDHAQLLGPPSPLNLGVRITSPALSTSSRSTPNLLNPPLHPAEIHSRGSSLSWPDTSRQTPSSHIYHVPGSCGTRQSSREGLDAAAEFLCMRNSPLDDLTERLSRLAAGRRRSVGRSWERLPGRSRVSLLTGDPFRQEGAQDLGTGVPSPDNGAGHHRDGNLNERYHEHLLSGACSRQTITRDGVPALSSSDKFEMSSPPRSRLDSVRRRRRDAEDDPVALAMALPPSSPLASSSQRLPSTPLVRTELDASSPRSPLAQRSPKKPISSPPASIKRRPVPSSPVVQATPKVKVYNDGKSPTTQPQTPADMGRSARRAKSRSETATEQSPLVIDRAAFAALPNALPVSERHPYRSTYPPEPHVDAGAATHLRGSMRVQSQRSSENDDIEGSLMNLVEDRRTWISRREGGGLDVTPPREGRFEWYLS